MAEMERFEREFGAALVRYADEVPTDVDAVAVTRAIADADVRDRWSWLGLRRSDRARPALRLALVMAALLALAIGMVALARFIFSTPDSTMLTGRMTCTGAWSTTSSMPIECSIQTTDERVAGTTDLRIDPPVGVAEIPTRTGSIELHTRDGAWTGSLHLAIAANGAASGDAVLVGRGSADGLILRLRISSADGLRWGVFGVIGDG